MYVQPVNFLMSPFFISFPSFLRVLAFIRLLKQKSLPPINRFRLPQFLIKIKVEQKSIYRKDIAFCIRPVILLSSGLPRFPFRNWAYGAVFFRGCLYWVDSPSTSLAGKACGSCYFL